MKQFESKITKNHSKKIFQPQTYFCLNVIYYNYSWSKSFINLFGSPHQNLLPPFENNPLDCFFACPK